MTARTDPTMSRRGYGRQPHRTAPSPSPRPPAPSSIASHKAAATAVADGCVWKYHGGSGGATGNVITTADGPKMPTAAIRAMLTPIAVSAVLLIHR